MSFKNTALKIEGSVARLTINRPNSLNSLDRETLEEIRRAFLDLKENPDVRVVVVSGAGGKAFSVGADLKGGMFSLGTTQAEAFGLSRLGQETFNIIEDFEKPVVAAVDGYALGGGFELALACDLIVTSERSMFGQAEINLGLIPGWGGSQRLTRIVGKNRAKLMAFTGDMVSAEEAKSMGLVSKVFPAAEFERGVDEFVSKLVSKSPAAVSLVKSAINKGLEVSLEKGLEYETQNFAKCFETVEYRERLKAFLEKRKPTDRAS